MALNSNHCIVHPSRDTERNPFVWVATFLCLAIFSEAAFAAEFLTDAGKQLKIDRMYADYKKDFPGVADFSAVQILRLKDRIKIVLVDIREPEEQEVSMIPGAIMEREFLENFSAYQNYIVIAYCTIGSRSGMLAQKFKKNGISMFNLSGGILAWLHAGGIVHKDGKPVKRVHVYGKKWNLAPTAIESVW